MINNLFLTTGSADAASGGLSSGVVSHLSRLTITSQSYQNRLLLILSQPILTLPKDILDNQEMSIIGAKLSVLRLHELSNEVS